MLMFLSLLRLLEYIRQSMMQAKKECEESELEISLDVFIAQGRSTHYHSFQNTKIKI